VSEASDFGKTVGDGVGGGEPGPSVERVSERVSDAEGSAALANDPAGRTWIDPETGEEVFEI
jgi:hypothetical protein